MIANLGPGKPMGLIYRHQRWVPLLLIKAIPTLISLSGEPFFFPRFSCHSSHTPSFCSHSPIGFSLCLGRPLISSVRPCSVSLSRKSGSVCLAIISDSHTAVVGSVRNPWSAHIKLLKPLIHPPAIAPSSPSLSSSS